MDRIYQTSEWTDVGFLAHDVDKTLPLDIEFHGVFTFDGRTGFGMFKGKVTRVDEESFFRGITMTWINESGRKLLDTMVAVRTSLPPNQAPVMRVTLTYPTVNWSLSGMLVGECPHVYEDGALIRGMIRGEHSNSAGMFQARVVKFNNDKQILALAFTQLSDQLFDMLEGAIKKFVQG